jgi:hypothetical protein
LNVSSQNSHYIALCKEEFLNFTGIGKKKCNFLLFVLIFLLFATDLSLLCKGAESYVLTYHCIIISPIKAKLKLSLKQAMEAHKVARRRGSHIFYIIGSQMAVRS